MTKNDFSKNNKARNISNELLFSHYFENSFFSLGHGKHQKSPGKGHGKSWNFIRSKEYISCFIVPIVPSHFHVKLNLDLFGGVYMNLCFKMESDKPAIRRSFFGGMQKYSNGRVGATLTPLRKKTA